jgi:hypothetical protein
MRARLTGPQIAVMRSLFTRGGIGVPISLSRRLQIFVRDLWRRELVQVWHRIAPERGSEGPYCSLTQSGVQLASALFHSRAPRRFSGAEQSS